MYEDYIPEMYIPQREKVGYVYLIGVKNHKAYKIGHSIHPLQRMKTLQAGRAIELELIAMIQYADYQTQEFHWQSKYARYKLSGEWFALPDHEVEFFKSQAGQS